MLEWQNRGLIGERQGGETGFMSYKLCQFFSGSGSSS